MESPLWVATLPSSDIADLNSTQGRPVRASLRNGWLSRRARAAISPPASTTSTPSSRRIPSPRPEACPEGSSEATTTRLMPAARIASVQGGRATVMTAGLERHVHRRPVGVGAGVADRLDLGMRAAELGVEPDADHLTVARDHRTDHRVRADPPSALLRQLDRAGEQAAVGVGLEGHGAMPRIGMRAGGGPLVAARQLPAPQRPPRSRSTLISGPGSSYWRGK